MKSARSLQSWFAKLPMQHLDDYRQIKKMCEFTGVILTSKDDGSLEGRGYAGTPCLNISCHPVAQGYSVT